MTLSLRKWRAKATAEQFATLARRASTSVVTLRHILYGFRGGSAEFAVRVAKAAATINDGPGNIDQATICPACRKCKFYKPE